MHRISKLNANIVMYFIFLLPTEQSGRGRLQLDWSCWQRRVITLPFRGCFLPHTFTHKALFPTWIPVQPSICTGDLQHLHQLYRDLWCPGSSFMDFRVALIPHLPCPLWQESFQGRHSPDEDAYLSPTGCQCQRLQISTTEQQWMSKRVSCRNGKALQYLCLKVTFYA